MGYYEDEIAKIKQDLEKDPMGKAWENGIHYTLNGGYGYQIFDNSLQDQEKPMEIIEQADLDKLKQAIEHW